MDSTDPGPGEALPALGEAPEGFRSGFVAVIGLPNAGKSTLVNGLLGADALITSDKPQTTRYQVRCVATSATRQVIFVDTPGWLKRDRAIDRAMHREISKGLDGVDVALFVVDAREPRLDVVAGILARIRDQHPGLPVLAAVTKLDAAGKSKVLPVLSEVHTRFGLEVVPVSGLKGENLEELDRVLTGLLPPGPVLYPPDMRIDRPPAFLAAEFLREQLFRVLDKEVPFSTAVEIERMEGGDDGGPLEVDAVVFVERDSQKGIVIGKRGATLRQVERKARRRLKDFLGVADVELTTHVKVVADWRKKDARLRSLGIGTDE